MEKFNSFRSRRSEYQKKLLFLRRVVGMMLEKKGVDLGEQPIFSHNVQMLDGFQVGFMRPETFQKLCAECGLDAETSEAVMMQTTQNTEPHVHMEGDSLFLPLGAQHGYPQSRGGTYLGKYQNQKHSFDLKYIPAIQGKPFRIRPCEIHFFAPGKDAKFTAIAFVNPKIQVAEGEFDILRFDEKSLKCDGNKASVQLKQAVGSL